MTYNQNLKSVLFWFLTLCIRFIKFGLDKFKVECVNENICDITSFKGHTFRRVRNSLPKFELCLLHVVLVVSMMYKFLKI